MDKRMIIAIVIVIVVVAVYVSSRKKADPSSKAADPSSKAAGSSTKATLSGVHRAGCNGNYVYAGQRNNRERLLFKADTNNLATGQSPGLVVVTTEKGVTACKPDYDSQSVLWMVATSKIVNPPGTFTFDKALWSK